jgi:hypothetical protein
MPDDQSGGTQSNERARRLAKNESFFRDANEQLEREQHRWETSFDCICECSRGGCVQRIKLLITEYEKVRARGDHFVVAPGHEDTSIETVVEKLPTYVVVRKFGNAGDVARRTKPR